MKPSEKRWLCEVPDNPRQADVVLFFSCQSIGMPDKIFTMVDILERMGIDFVGLGGVDFCSGYFYLSFGYIEESFREAKRLISAVESFKPKKLVVWCPATYYRMTKILPKFALSSFQVQHVTQFISDNMHKLEFTKPLNKKVTLHDSCNLGRMSGEFDAPRSILQSIPGVRLIEMEHSGEEALCCGAAGASNEPEAGKKLRTVRLKEAKDTGADVLVDICLTCHEFLGHEADKYPFEIKNIISFLGEALDIKYEEKLLEYLACKNINEVLDEAKDYILESDFTIEEMRKFLPLYLGLRPS
jgi:Fe-S oxidoreductase